MLKKTKQNKGRSMIEMLSVLAIIGMLSIAAILGFKAAINKHYANETLKDVNLWAVEAVEVQKPVEFGETIETHQLGNKSTMGYFIGAVGAGEETFAIKVSGVPEGVCKKILDLAGDNYTITLNGMTEEDAGVFYEEDDTICQGDEDKILYFYFDKDLKKQSNYCLGICDDDETCCNNRCYPTEGICGGLCSCGEGKSCSNNVCCFEDIEACNGECCPNSSYVCRSGFCQCPENAVLNASGQCVCATGYTLDPETKTCVGLCCQGGSCYVGATDFKTCTGGKRCGRGCNATGTSCGQGLCTNQCPAGTEYVYDKALDLYGCLNRNNTPYLDDLGKYAKGTFCSAPGASYSCHFYEMKEECSWAANLLGTSGIGDCLGECAAGGQFRSVTDYLVPVYGCVDEENNISCYKSAGSGVRYSCSKDGKLCGTKCDSAGRNCATGSCHGEKVCNNKTEEMILWNNMYVCESENLYCTSLEGAYRCYLKENGDVCAYRCRNEDGTGCILGMCQDTCPDGYTFEKVGGYYACRNNVTGIGCFPQSANNYWCYDKNNKLCGNYCNWNGTAKMDGTGVCGSCNQTYTCPADGVFKEEKTISYCSYDNDAIRCNVVSQNNSNNTCYFTGNNNACCFSNTGNPNDCDKGSCYDDCDEGWVFDKEGSYMSYYGCIKKGSPKIACVKYGTEYTCYKDNEQCGTGCKKDGSGCTSGSCEISETDLTCITSCEEKGLQYASYRNGECFCSPIDTNIKCVAGTDNFTSCSINDSICGENCENTNKGVVCSIGQCQDSCYDEDLEFGSVGSYYGCINEESGSKCYWVAANNAYTCFNKDGESIGTNCDMDGYCY